MRLTRQQTHAAQVGHALSHCCPALHSTALRFTHQQAHEQSDAVWLAGKQLRVDHASRDRRNASLSTSTLSLPSPPSTPIPVPSL